MGGYRRYERGESYGYNPTTSLPIPRLGIIEQMNFGSTVAPLLKLCVVMMPPSLPYESQRRGSHVHIDRYHTAVLSGPKSERFLNFLIKEYTPVSLH